MNWTNLIIVLHVLIAFAIVGLVLLQHGRGADMGSGFGSGASGSLFGATGSANFLSRTTAVLAALFFISSLSLAYLATSKPRQGGGSVMERSAKEAAKPAAPAQQPAPAQPAESQPGSAQPKPPAGQGKEVPQ